MTPDFASIDMIVFWILFAGSLLGALYTVLVSRMVHATIGLMAVLMQSAFFYLLLGAEFIAGIQILVYVGGIVILIVFMVMLTRPVELTEAQASGGKKLMGGLIALSFWGLAVKSIWSLDFPNLASASEITVAQIGHQLLSAAPGGFLIPFEVVSILLLTAVIGSIVLARKHKETKP